ncbi:hypothetical protein UMN179_01057 [Gallibacterium anatis UMN179]|uniref:Uncharacterized protein n=1 Tax=Gallibacterium anatis (strain UMN179) TaxID=1005058 RepID=F4H8S9_GALAU|nr:hypothetical protein UMN179_01057 [Gallibacterium anatis UMN179]
MSSSTWATLSYEAFAKPYACVKSPCDDVGELHIAGEFQLYFRIALHKAVEFFP